MTCPCNRYHTQTFIAKLTKDKENFTVLKHDIHNLIQNLQNYLSNTGPVNGTQELLVYHQLFRGIVVKYWFGDN